MLGKSLRTYVNKKTDYNEKLLKDLIEKCKNLIAFWRKVKIMSSNREHVQNNITTDELKKYFENLLNGEEEIYLGNNDSINEVLIDNDIEYFILMQKLLMKKF